MSTLSPGFRAVSQASEDAIPALQGVVTAFAKLSQTLTEVTGNIAGPSTNALQALSSVMQRILPQISGVTTAFAGVGQQLLATMGSVAGSAGSIVGAVSSMFGGVGKALTGDLKGALSTATAGIGGLVSGLAGMAGGAGALLGGIAGLGQQMAGFVEKANPGILQMFINVLDDMQAIIGQALIPVFRIVTEVVRMGADSLASFLPQIGAVVGQMASAFLPVFQIAFDTFGKVGQAIGLVVQAAAPAVEAFGAMYAAIYGAFQPVIELVVQLVGGALAQAMKWLADGVKTVTPYIMAFAHVLKDAFQWVSNTIKELLAMVGITLPELEAPKPGASVGAAAKGTNIGSVESLLNKAMQSAFGLGTAAEDPAAKTASIAGELKAKADEIEKVLRGLPKMLWDMLPGSIKEFLSNMLIYFRVLTGTPAPERAGTGVRETGVGIVPTGGSEETLARIERIRTERTVSEVASALLTRGVGPPAGVVR